MKVQVKEDSKKFEPIELTITIESEEELCDLWYRFNIRAKAIDKGSLDILKHKAIDSQEPWLIIDELVRQRNLKK